jgi:hypothetical protein
MATLSTADPCDGALPASAFVADMGALVTPAGGCALVVETKPSPSLFSWGGARLDHDVDPDLDVSVTWRRLGERGGASIELVVPGVTLMVRDGAIGWWENDARWANDGWIPVVVDTSRVHTLRVAQHGADLRAWLDGAELPAFHLMVEPGPGRLSFALKGGSGDRARLWASQIRLRQP